MKSVILCEGFDDVYIIGYYLHKTCGWNPSFNERMSEHYKLPKVNSKNQLIEMYQKGDDKAAVWCVGGKDSFKSAYEFLYEVNQECPSEAINQVFIFTDRDKNEIEVCLEKIKDEMTEANIQVQKLENDCANVIRFIVEEDEYEQKIIPMVIPFNKKGAIETLLMNAIAQEGEEEKNIVKSAKEYISQYLGKGDNRKYLKSERKILKATFSAVISITNPDRSTALFDKLLMTHDWEKSEVINSHLHMFNELL